MTDLLLADTRATLVVRPAGLRYLVRIVSADHRLWEEVAAAFRWEFRGHGDRVYRRSSGCWSVPRRHQARLKRFCEASGVTVDWPEG